jgi:hypothetical protein
VSARSRPSGQPLVGTPRNFLATRSVRLLASPWLLLVTSRAPPATPSDSSHPSEIQPLLVTPRVHPSEIQPLLVTHMHCIRVVTRSNSSFRPNHQIPFVLTFGGGLVHWGAANSVLAVPPARVNFCWTSHASLCTPPLLARPALDFQQGTWPSCPANPWKKCRVRRHQMTRNEMRCWIPQGSSRSCCHP